MTAANDGSQGATWSFAESFDEIHLKSLEWLAGQPETATTEGEERDVPEVTNDVA